MDARDADPTRPEGAQSFRFGLYSYTTNPDIGDQPKFVQLKAYWDARRGPARMPSRSQIDPLDLAGHLGSLILAEPLPGRQDVRFRLVGTHIVEACGRDSTGRLLSEVAAMMDADYHRCLAGAYRAVLAQGVIARGQGSLGVRNYDWKFADVLLLPLDAGDGSVGMILGEILFAA